MLTFRQAKLNSYMGVPISETYLWGCEDVYQNKSHKISLNYKIWSSICTTQTIYMLDS